MKEKLVEKTRNIIDLENEKQNWNKVSYTKFLDKQLLDKKKDLEVMTLRLNHTNKQNSELRQKNNELKNKIKELCSNNNIDLSDDISLSESVADNSNIDVFSEHQHSDCENQNIIMDMKTIEEKSNLEENESVEEKVTAKLEKNDTVEETDTEQEKVTAKLENQSNICSKSEDTESQDSILTENLEDYSKYEYTNKSGKSRKYLKREIKNKIYLYKYTSDLENIGEPVGEIRKKAGVSKPSFYRKKTK